MPEDSPILAPMPKLLDQALEAARRLDPRRQDEIARVILQLAESRRPRPRADASQSQDAVLGILHRIAEFIQPVFEIVRQQGNAEQIVLGAVAVFVLGGFHRLSIFLKRE